MPEGIRDLGYPHASRGEFGPRRVSQDELRAAFSDGWAVASIEAEEFELYQATFGIASAQAWLAVIQRPG